MPAPTTEELRKSIEDAIYAELADGRTRMTNSDLSFRVAENGTIGVLLFLPDYGVEVGPIGESPEKAYNFRIRVDIVE